jgi:hypothetical protein
MLPNSTASAIRSQLASSTVPNRVTRPEVRAIEPSSRSESRNAITTRVPASSWPCGKNHRAAATVPTVPITVIAFGVRPARTSRAPIGSVTRETDARAKMFSIGLSVTPAGTGSG